MKINLIRYANSLDPNATYHQDSERFIEDVNNELFDDDIELVDDLENSSYSIIFIETGGSEQKFIKDVDTLPRPFILLSSSMNNSLPACLEIKTYIETVLKEEVIVLFGEEKDVAESLKRVNKVVLSSLEIKDCNLGVIGKPSDWLIASKVDYEKAHKKFGLNLIDISTSELKEEIDKGLIKNIPHQKELLNKYDKEVLDVALKIYSGLKRIIDKYRLKGFTLRCFDLIEEYKNTACLAFALLNEEGIIAACEGDVPSLLTMMLVKQATGQSSFMANPSRIDILKGNILFSHCTLPLNMCREYELMTHFESGLGIGVRGKLDKKEITITKITPDLNDILCISGTIVDNLTLPNYCRTQISVDIQREEVFDFLKTSFGNHVIICYGDQLAEILTLFHFYLDIK